MIHRGNPLTAYVGAAEPADDKTDDSVDDRQLEAGLSDDLVSLGLSVDRVPATTQSAG